MFFTSSENIFLGLYWANGGAFISKLDEKKRNKSATAIIKLGLTAFTCSLINYEYILVHYMKNLSPSSPDSLSTATFALEK